MRLPLLTRYEKIQTGLLVLFPYVSLVPGLIKLEPYKIITLAATLVFVAFFIATKMKVVIPVSAAIAWLFVFTLLYVLSSVVHVVDYGWYGFIKGIGYYTLYPILLTLIFFWLGKDVRRRKFIIWNFSVSGVLLAVAVLFVSIYIGDESFRNAAGTMNLWVFDNTLLGNPNSTARFLVAIYPFVLWHAVERRSIKWSAAMLLLVASIYITTSKSGIALMLLVLPWLGYVYRHIPLARKLLVLSALVSAIGLIGVSGYVEQKFERYEQQSETLGYYSLRMPIWNAAFSVSENTLMLGLGAGQAQKALGNDKELMRILEEAQHRMREVIDTHNLYLKLLIEGGGISLLFFLFYLFAVTRTFVFNCSCLGGGFAVPLLVMSAGGIFADVYNEGWLWALIGIGLACVDHERNSVVNDVECKKSDMQS